MQLIDQAKTLLERNRPDAAISLLERAVSIYPANGLSFYYLAEAWFMKGNKDQAREFNRLAIRHFGKNSEWSTAVNEQKEKILNN
jgi:predicted Zn-dependent protease